MPQPARFHRLIDLHCDWILQYATETTLFDPALYQGVKGRLAQAEGYLDGTSLSILSCFRKQADWQTQEHPWQALDALITRVEAEFPGRLLIGPDDLHRWRDDPEGLCWASIGIEGFDALIREPGDLEHLRRLFDRGVRLFQPLYSASNSLGGSSEPGDDRGLTPLGIDFIKALLELSAGTSNPKPILDLAHMNPKTMSETLSLFENESSWPDRLLLVYSHGAIAHEGFSTPRALSLENLRRLRALGGTVGLSVGPPFYHSKDEWKQSIATIAELPMLGKPGIEGIAIGTDFLGVDQTLPGLSNVTEAVEWVTQTFSESEAESLLVSAGRLLIERSIGQQ